MNSTSVYVLDTHALVWFLKRDRPIGVTALKILLSRSARLVVPIYVFDEIRMKSLGNTSSYKPDRIGIPPATALRVIARASNIKSFPKSPAVLFEEERLRREVRFRKVLLDAQDIPICATALAIQKALSPHSQTYIMSKDTRIRNWKRVPIIWA